MTIDTSTNPDLIDKSIKKIWIKDGKRKLMSDSGFMMMGAPQARQIFGRLRGGKYSLKQTK